MLAHFLTTLLWTIIHWFHLLWSVTVHQPGSMSMWPFRARCHSNSRAIKSTSSDDPIHASDLALAGLGLLLHLRTQLSLCCLLHSTLDTFWDILLPLCLNRGVRTAVSVGSLLYLTGLLAHLDLDRLLLLGRLLLCVVRRHLYGLKVQNLTQLSGQICVVLELTLWLLRCAANNPVSRALCVQNSRNAKWRTYFSQPLFVSCPFLSASTFITY